MNDKQRADLIVLIKEAVSACKEEAGGWVHQRTSLLRLCNDAEREDIEEFVSWFELEQ